MASDIANDEPKNKENVSISDSGSSIKAVEISRYGLNPYDKQRKRNDDRKEAIKLYESVGKEYKDISNKDAIITEAQKEIKPAGVWRSRFERIKRHQGKASHLKEISKVPELKKIRAGDVNKERCPEGFIEASEFINSDDYSAIFRCFGQMRARILLKKQAELCKIEEDIRGMDDYDMRMLEELRMKFILTTERKERQAIQRIINKKEWELRKLYFNPNIISKTNQQPVDNEMQGTAADDRGSDEGPANGQTSDEQLEGSTGPAAALNQATNDQNINNQNAGGQTDDNQATHEAVNRGANDQNPNNQHDSGQAGDDQSTPNQSDVDQPPDREITDDQMERLELLELFETKLREYDELLRQYKEILSLPRATKWQIELFWNYMVQYNPFTTDEGKFLDDPDDIITLRKESLDLFKMPSFLTGLFFGMPPTFLGFISKGGNGPMRGHPNFRKISRNGMIRFGRLLFGLIITVLVVVGVIVLYSIRYKKEKIRLGTLVAFTGLCALLLSGLTKAKLGEIVGGTAAYCAILVVFISGDFIKQDTAN